MKKATTAHPAIERLTEQGYELYWNQPFSGQLDIEARLDGSKVAEADFMGQFGSAHCNNVKVEDEHRRKGIATGMYVLAEQLWRTKLENFWDGDPKQSDAAKAFWAKPNRPFGE